MAPPRRRLVLQRGRPTPPRDSAPAPAQPPGQKLGPTQRSQAVARGQGLGIGLALLTLGAPPGRAVSGGGATFPASGVLDTFTRGDSANLGSNWNVLVPSGGTGGFAGQTLGISTNAAYNPLTVGANKNSEYWNVSTPAGNVEAFCYVKVTPGDFYGVALRCQNVGLTTVKFYFVSMIGTSWHIDRWDNRSSSSSIATGSTTALGVGDGIGGRIYTNAAGNVVVEHWLFRASSTVWSRTASATDSNASKITADGNLALIIGNPNGSSAGRMVNFGGGTF